MRARARPDAPRTDGELLMLVQQSRGRGGGLHCVCARAYTIGGGGGINGVAGRDGLTCRRLQLDLLVACGCVYSYSITGNRWSHRWIDLGAGDLITVLGTFTYAYFTGGSILLMNGGNMISLALAYMVD
jgi:hypothetical protein